MIETEGQWLADRADVLGMLDFLKCHEPRPGARRLWFFAREATMRPGYDLESQRRFLRYLAGAGYNASEHSDPAGEFYDDSVWVDVQRPWGVARAVAYRLVPAEHRRSGTALLREVMGNPFRRPRPVYNPASQAGTVACCPDEFVFHREWLTEQVVTLAGELYEAQDWEGLPALADALEEAGACFCEDLLRHLRGQERCWLCHADGYSNPYTTARGDCSACEGTGWATLRAPHVRGCWALDLCLGHPY